MRSYVCLAAVWIATANTMTAQLPAQKGTPGTGNRPAAAPKGKTTVAEPTKTPQTQLAPKAGGKPKVVAALVSADYAIGVQGYPTDAGVVVMSTVKLADKNQRGKRRSAAEEIDVDLKGNGRTVKLKLEAGDTITSVDGSVTNTLDELVAAINSASDPHALEISFIDWRTGNECTGTINAVKKK